MNISVGISKRAHVNGNRLLLHDSERGPYQFSEYLIDFVWRQRHSLVQPPIQHQNESGSHVFGHKIRWHLARWPPCGSKFLFHSICDNLREDPSQVLMQNSLPSGADSVTLGVRMAVVVLENRKAEPEKPSWPFPDERTKSTGRRFFGAEEPHFLPAMPFRYGRLRLYWTTSTSTKGLLA
jgi:hypothetical protein